MPAPESHCVTEGAPPLIAWRTSSAPGHFHRCPCASHPVAHSALQASLPAVIRVTSRTMKPPSADLEHLRAIGGITEVFGGGALGVLLLGTVVTAVLQIGLHETARFAPSAVTYRSKMRMPALLAAARNSVHAVALDQSVTKATRVRAAEIVFDGARRGRTRSCWRGSRTCRSRCGHGPPALLSRSKWLRSCRSEPA